MPPELWQLQYNPKTGFYEIEEDKVLYKMQLEETRSLRDYYRFFRSGGGVLYPSLSRWYKDLPAASKKKVIREGDIPAQADGFYPDPEYQDF